MTINHLGPSTDDAAPAREDGPRLPGFHDCRGDWQSLAATAPTTTAGATC